MGALPKFRRFFHVQRGGHDDNTNLDAVSTINFINEAQCRYQPFVHSASVHYDDRVFAQLRVRCGFSEEHTVCHVQNFGFLIAKLRLKPNVEPNDVAETHFEFIRDTARYRHRRQTSRLRARNTTPWLQRQ